MTNDRPKILCVDDEMKNLDLYKAVLDPRGFQIVRAKSGTEALERAREEKIDLVLLDVMMPDMDGFEACRRLKADPGTTAIPVVMITALDDQNSLVKGLRAGTTLFLSKPLGDRDLVFRIKCILGMPG